MANTRFCLSCFTPPGRATFAQAWSCSGCASSLREVVNFALREPRCHAIDWLWHTRCCSFFGMYGYRGSNFRRLPIEMQTACQSYRGFAPAKRCGGGGGSQSGEGWGRFHWPVGLSGPSRFGRLYELHPPQKGCRFAAQ